MRRKRLSTNVEKKDIKVLQNNDVEASVGFLQLPGLETANYGEVIDEHLYADVAEVTETVPKYTIPVTNANFPDVKVSIL